MSPRNPESAWQLYDRTGPTERVAELPIGKAFRVGDQQLMIMRVAWRSKSHGLLIQVGDPKRLAAAQRLVERGLLAHGRYGNRAVGWLHAFILTERGLGATIAHNVEDETA